MKIKKELLIVPNVQAFTSCCMFLTPTCEKQLTKKH